MKPDSRESKLFGLLFEITSGFPSRKSLRSLHIPISQISERLGTTLTPNILSSLTGLYGDIIEPIRARVERKKQVVGYRIVREWQPPRFRADFLSMLKNPPQNPQRNSIVRLPNVDGLPKGSEAGRRPVRTKPRRMKGW